MDMLELVCPVGVTLASKRGMNLRDARVSDMLQVASEPLFVFARVDRRSLVERLAECQVIIVESGSDGVLSNVGTLKIDTETLRRCLEACGCSTVICYQYGLKSRSQAYWSFVSSLCAGVPTCEDNVFHISRTFSGMDESGKNHICIFKGFSVNDFVSVEVYPLLKDLGGGFGGCEIRDALSDVRLTVYATVVHILKRHGISNLKIPSTVVDCRYFLRRLEAFHAILSGEEKRYIGGFRFELLCKASNPEECMQRFSGYLDPGVWVSAGALSARTISVDEFLQSIADALDAFRYLEVAHGDNKDTLSRYR